MSNHKMNGMLEDVFTTASGGTAVDSSEPTVITRCYTTQESEILRAARGISIERHSELCQAEREGNIVIIPCKVGQKIWRIYGKQIRTGIISDVRFWDYGEAPEFEFDCSYNFIFCSGDINKTIFFTREDAEAAKEAGE